MDTLSAVILGIVQGLCEFLPISSSGHLILIREALSIRTSHELAYDAVLQLATIFAVIVYFFPDIWRLFHAAMRMMGRLEVDKKDKTLITALLIGTIPAVVFGLLLEDFMETTFRAPILVAFVLVAGSGLLAYAEFAFATNTAPKHELTVRSGIIVGFFQCLALIPGMSRSGATIAGGLILGLTRYEATRFAFLLSIPIIVGSGLKKLLELMKTPAPDISFISLAIGGAVAFFVGLFAIHFMLKFVRNHTLWVFIWYRIAVALIVLIVVFTQ